MVVVEEEPLVGGDADPVPTPHLTLKLAGGPAGVSEDEERAPGALAPAHRLQDLGVRRERDAVLDDARRSACVVLGVQDEHARWLHRSAVVHPDATAHALAVHAEPREEIRERDLANGDRKSTRLNSSHLVISYAVFC